MAIYEYSVHVMGDCYINGNWAYDFFHLCDIPMGSESEAVEYLLGITKEQALEWERNSESNGLYIVAYADEINPFTGCCGDSYYVATCEWIDDKLNGVWLGDYEERIDPIR